MTTAITNAELSRLFSGSRSREAERAQGVFQAALRAHDALRLTGLPQLLAYLADRIRAWRTAAELRALTDRELADIGLTRSDIGRITAA